MQQPIDTKLTPIASSQSALPSFDPDEMTSVVSYELRTPLTSIRAALGLLAVGNFGVLPEKGQRLLEIAINNTERLLRIVEALEQEEPIPLSCPAAANQLALGAVADPIQKILPLKLWQQQVHYDKLTGLPTQLVFLDWLKQAIAYSQEQPNYQFAVLTFDLDRFQLVNDSLGYALGDQLLVAIARRLEENLPTPLMMARLQEDEFGILVECVGSAQEVIAKAEAIQQVLSTPFIFEGQTLFLTASIGIVWGQEKCNSPESLIHKASTAMHRAKVLGKNGYILYSDAVRTEASSRLRLETDLRLAIERQEFVLYYQPIIQLKTDALLGFEALIRWQHPERGFISPTQFIGLAEETGLIRPIGLWVLRSACQQLAIWQQRPGCHSLTMSVNLSTEQLSQPDLIAQVQEILQETAIAPQALKLEITENALIKSPEQAADMLRQLKELGVQLCIDDFGTGYSSLSYLHRFPFDFLKIDRSFVNRIDADAEQLEIVRAITKLAWNLGMTVVVEGVETTKQATQLKLLQCDYAQGYLFSEPVNLQTAETLLKKVLHSQPE